MEIIILESKHAGSLVKSVLDLKIENFNEKIKKTKYLNRTVLLLYL